MMVSWVVDSLEAVGIFALTGYLTFSKACEQNHLGMLCFLTDLNLSLLVEEN